MTHPKLQDQRSPSGPHASLREDFFEVKDYRSRRFACQTTQKSSPHSSVLNLDCIASSSVKLVRVELISHFKTVHHVCYLDLFQMQSVQEQPSLIEIQDCKSLQTQTLVSRRSNIKLLIRRTSSN
ncbi:hypothetical protein RDI58_024827 [Solanum bulbocastanum]|uniref:Uncharacterized protein n=1 Tax=Solanum bulbocastanum TaxID=147425 RepID=A0AAN8SYZ5_SOLBU